MKKHVDIVIDTTFGDAGKGMLVDNLCSYDKHPEEESLVVRFSGGQQCGHTVNTGLNRHVFSNFGSGTYLGCKTYYTQDTTFYPVTFMRERKILLDEGVKPQIMLHPLVKVTTPFDVFYNRARERQYKHGSCGLGVGATMTRCNTTGHQLYAIDLDNTEVFSQKVKQIKNFYEAKAKVEGLVEFFDPVFQDKLVDELLIFFDNVNYIHHNRRNSSTPFLWINQLVSIQDNYKHIVFEGSQGVLLDKDHGIFPNVTYANTTCKNAIIKCHRFGWVPTIHYITRSYLTRHGIGWMSNETEPPHAVKDATNVENEWQGALRFGEFDVNLVKQGINFDMIYQDVPINERRLYVTCMDQVNLDLGVLEVLIDENKIDSIYSNNSEVRGHIHRVSV